MKNFQFPVIDKVSTGNRLREEFKKRGISAREVQELLCMGSTQTIYDWYIGRTLPSLDNMVALSRVLECKVEDLLVFRSVEEKREQGK